MLNNEAAQPHPEPAGKNARFSAHFSDTEDTKHKTTTNEMV